MQRNGNGLLSSPIATDYIEVIAAAILLNNSVIKDRIFRPCLRLVNLDRPI